MDTNKAHKHIKRHTYRRRHPCAFISIVQGGFPRHLADPSEFVSDWVTTIRVLASSRVFGATAVPNTQLVLWGTSYAGGHIIVAYHNLTAHYKQTVKGLVSVTPFMDGKKNLVESVKLRGLFGSLRLAGAFMTDIIRSKAHRLLLPLPHISPSPTCSPSPPFSTSLPSSLSPLLCSSIYIKIACRLTDHHDLCMMPLTDSDYHKWIRKLPASKCFLGAWRNAVVVRSATYASSYKPIDYLMSLLSVPVLFVVAGEDTVVLNEGTRFAIDKLKARGGTVHLMELPKASHFDIYDSPVRDQITEATLHFLRDPTDTIPSYDGEPVLDGRGVPAA
eukprot:GHVS01023830.1.p1 GENE.GHVS01023830.1~~GHVS01023830.1.p1  ORF type:complete len:332 (-),score=37.88 GHVS01023830.1:141-1136(-)